MDYIRFENEVIDGNDIFIHFTASEHHFCSLLKIEDDEPLSTSSSLPMTAFPVDIPTSRKRGRTLLTNWLGSGTSSKSTKADDDDQGNLQKKHKVSEDAAPANVIINVANKHQNKKEKHFIVLFKR